VFVAVMRCRISGDTVIKDRCGFEFETLRIGVLRNKASLVDLEVLKAFNAGV